MKVFTRLNTLSNNWKLSEQFQIPYSLHLGMSAGEPQNLEPPLFRVQTWDTIAVAVFLGKTSFCWDKRGSFLLLSITLSSLLNNSYFIPTSSAPVALFYDDVSLMISVFLNFLSLEFLQSIPSHDILALKCAD